MAKKEEKKINFQVKGIELLNHQLLMPQKQIPQDVVFHFNIGLEQNLDKNNNLIVIITNVEITQNGDTSNHFARASVACIYSIENFDAAVLIDDQDVKIDEQFSWTLNAISLSSTRGVLSQLFKGTYLHNAIMPIVDPKSFAVTK